MNTITVKIDGVPIDVTLDDGNIYAIYIGGVNTGTLLDTVCGGNRVWWRYFESVIDRELAIQKREAEERAAHDAIAAREDNAA